MYYTAKPSSMDSSWLQKLKTNSYKLNTTQRSGDPTEVPSIMKSDPLNHLKSGLLKTGINVTMNTDKQLIATMLIKNCFATIERLKSYLYLQCTGLHAKTYSIAGTELPKIRIVIPPQSSLAKNELAYSEYTKNKWNMAEKPRQSTAEAI